MELKLLARLMVRLIGIVMLVSQLESGAGLLQEYSRNGLEGVSGSLVLVLMLVFLLLAVLLLVFPAYIAALVLPVTSLERNVTEETEEDGTVLMSAMLPLAASLAGLYFLFAALSDFAYNVTHWLATRELNPVAYTRYWTVEKIAGFLTVLVQLVAGLYLLFGAKGLVKLLRWVRGVHPNVK